MFPRNFKRLNKFNCQTKILGISNQNAILTWNCPLFFSCSDKLTINRKKLKQSFADTITPNKIMESYEEINKKIMHNGESGASQRILLEAKIAELARIKEDLNRARESAMQSYLDSKPLIDELEKQKSNLADAKNRSDASNAIISELESQLETINKSIESKREDHLKVEKRIGDMNHVLEQTHNDMEGLKQEIMEERKVWRKLRQTQQIRKQTLKTLQLTLQAVLIESDAFEKSAAKALYQTSLSDTHTATVQLTHEEYHALRRRAEAIFSRANQHISISIEQKLAAEATRESALSRLNKFHTSRSWRMNRINTTEQCHTERDAEKQESSARGEPASTSYAKVLKKSERAKPHESGSKTETINNNPSVLRQTKRCLGQKIKKLFG